MANVELLFADWLSCEPSHTLSEFYLLREAFCAGYGLAAKQEREACAKLADRDDLLDMVGGSTGNAKGTAENIAAAIRARAGK